MLCFKLTQKLAKRLHGELSPLPPSDCPTAFCWLANEFNCHRVRYIIVTHQATLFSAVMPAKGVNTVDAFVHSAARAIGWTAIQGDAKGVYERFVASELGNVFFSKIDSKPALGSMNDLTRISKFMLEPEDERSPIDLSCALNVTPMSMLGGICLPREAFKKLHGFRLV